MGAAWQGLGRPFIGSRGDSRHDGHGEVADKQSGAQRRDDGHPVVGVAGGLLDDEKTGLRIRTGGVVALVRGPRRTVSAARRLAAWRGRVVR